MCAMFTDEPAGKPVRLTTKVTLAAGTLFAASRVTTIVIVALPLTVDSALVNGGPAFAGESAGVNAGLVGAGGVGGLWFVQPAGCRPTTPTMGDRRSLARLPFSQ